MKGEYLTKLAAFTLNGILLLAMNTIAQEPYRAATTTASFLEIGYGSRINAMGDAGVAAVRDISSIYWKPAGLGYLQQQEATI